MSGDIVGWHVPGVVYFVVDGFILVGYVESGCGCEESTDF